MLSILRKPRACAVEPEQVRPLLNDPLLYAKQLLATREIFANFITIKLVISH